MMTNLQQMFAGSHANKLTHTSRVTLIGKGLSFLVETFHRFAIYYHYENKYCLLINHLCLFLYLGQFVTKVLIPFYSLLSKRVFKS